MNEQVISEAASEKPKRGRPPVFDPSIVAAFGGVARAGRSDRSRINGAYRNIAIAVLQGSGREAEFIWLVNFEGVLRGDLHCWQPEILTELGRLRWSHGDEAMLEMASKICKEREPSHTSKYICWYIRQARTGKLTDLVAKAKAEREEAA